MMTDISTYTAIKTTGNLRFVGKFKRSTPRTRWNIEPKIRGIYIISADGIPFYVGESLVCMRNRFISHKYSIRNPEYRGEITGRIVKEKGLQDSVFSIECLYGDDLGIYSRKDNLVVEYLLQLGYLK